MAKEELKKAKRYHIRSKDREYFTANLALLLKAAVPVGESLASLQETSHSSQLNKAIEQMRDDIEEGTPLWRALERSHIVSTQTLSLIRLGEQSGNLVENLRVAAEQDSKQRVFRSKIRSALIYPSFVLSLTAIVGIGVAWFLLPRLSETFSQLNVELPLISKILIGFGLFLKDNGLWAVPAGIGTALLLGYIVFAAPKTRILGQVLLFRLPGISRLLYEVEIARFGYLLGTLLKAGLSVTQALDLLYDATSSLRYKKLYRYLSRSFEDGYGFRTSLTKYRRINRLIPPAVQQMIIAGERSGALSETLVSVGEIYDEKANSTTQNLEVILEPILLVIVWLGVLGVAVAVILPIYGLIGGLGA